MNSKRYINLLGLTFLFFWGIGKPFLLLQAQNAQLIDSLHQDLQKSNTDTSKVLILCELSKQLAELDSSKAFSYAQQALSLSQELHYSYGEGYSTHMLGYIYDCNYNVAKAIEYYQQSLVIKEKNGDVSGISASFVNIGLINYYQGDYEKALDYYNKGIEKSRSIGDSLAIASIYNNTAVVYRRLQKYDKALELYLASLAIKQKMGDQKGIASSYSNLSTLYQYKEDLDKALEYEEQALAIEKELQNLRGIAHSMMSIGHIFYWKENYSTAATNIRQAIVWADSAKAFDIMARGYGSLSEVDSLLGNLPLSFSDYKKHIFYKEMVFKEQERERIAVLQTIYETDKKEQALELSQKENKILAQQNILQLQTTRFWTLLTFTIVAFLGVLLFYYRAKQKNYLLLQEKNKTISSALHEKELLLKEIHHRVKNNLQIISGLLHWQSQQSDDEQLKKTVLEGKNRLKSMAMIHQRLYQDDNQRSISIKEYVQELVTELSTSHGINSQEMNIKTIIDPLFLDVDTMIPLGLILTELIGNSIKHAFVGKEGLIEVTIQEKNETLSVSVADNGIGFVQNELSVDKNTKKRFGLSLVKMLAQKIDAELVITKNKGTIITLMINNFKATNA